MDGGLELHFASGGDASRPGREDRAERLPWLGVIAISIAALVWRLPGFDPPSLYLDDQWVSIVVHQMSWSQFFRLAPPVPPGFVALERLFSALSTDREWPLQVLPVLASIALVPAIFWLARRLTASAGAGLLAAALLLTDPMLAVYAVAAKQYSTDALIVLVLLAIGLPLLAQWSSRRAWALALVALLALPISFSSLFASVPLVHLSLIAAWKQRGRHIDLARSALPSVILFDLAMATYYLAILRRQARQSMSDYWSEYFPASLAPAELATFVAERGGDFVTQALPHPLRWLALLCIPAVIFLLARESTRLSGVFFLVFYLQMVVAGALGLFPIGTGRADLFAHGPTLLLVSVGVHAVARSMRVRPRVAGGIAGALALVSIVAFGQRSAYRTSGDDATLVRQLEERLLPTDGLIVYPLSTFALGVYGSWPVRLDQWPAQGTGFEVVVERQHTLSQHSYPGYINEPRLMQGDVRELLSHGYDRVVLFTATEAKRPVQLFFHEELVAAGYRVATESSEPPHVLCYQKTRS